MDFSFIDTLKFDTNGLIPCIAQDADNGEVLMVAYMNKDALIATLKPNAAGKKLAQYWSRSRQKFWIKGESSGNTQEVLEVRFDCDRDCVLLKVQQNVAACHTGHRSCFYNLLQDDGTIQETGELLFNPDQVYQK